MKRLTHKRSNGIKDGYWSPNKKDELVARLAQYENTGLTPEEIAQLQHKGNTNADRIRSMSDEDLALNIMCPYDSDMNCNEKSCYTCALKWLQQEAEDDKRN